MSDDLRKLVTNAIAMQVNSQYYDHSRERLFGSHMGLDGKRCNAYAEYGFPSDISFHNLLMLYKRGGIAHGAVNKLSGKCWETHPWIIEGYEDKEASDFTDFDNASASVLSGNIWRAFFEADKRRLVGRYSALILKLSDAKTEKGYANAVKSKSTVLAGVIPVWQNALTPQKKDAFGNVSLWNYKTSNGSQITVHSDRVIILGDTDDRAIAFLEAAYNNGVTLEKVEGGSGESFMKNAARQLGINFDKEVKVDDIARAVGKKPEEIQEVFDDVVKGINRGEDNAIVTIGANVTPLVTSMPDPRPTYEINVQSFCAAVDIPSRILIGNQQGERASTEDNKYFNARCQSRRKNELSYDIAAFIDRLMKFGALPYVEKYTVMWDDLTAFDTATRLANAKTMSDINNVASATGSPIFTDEEIRVEAGFEAKSEVGLGENED